MKPLINTSLINIYLVMIAFATISFPQEKTNAAKTENRNLFTLSAGISLHSVRDEMMSPLIYHGYQVPFDFSYRYLGISNRHMAIMYYDQCDLNSSITDNSSHLIRNLNLNFEYTFATKIKEFTEYNTTCFLGGGLTSMLNLRNHYFLQDKSHMSGEQMTGLGLCLLSETILGRESQNILSVKINMPFITYALLNDRYNANVSEKFDDLDFDHSILWQIFKKGDIVTFNKLFEIQMDLSYDIFFSNYTGLNLRYQFQFYSFAQYKDLFRSRVLNNRFLIGFMVKL